MGFKRESTMAAILKRNLVKQKFGSNGSTRNVTIAAKLDGKMAL